MYKCYKLFFFQFDWDIIDISVWVQHNDLSFICCSSVAKSCLTLCDPMDCNRPGSSVLRCLLEFAQFHIHWVSDAVEPSHPLLPPSFFPSLFPSITVVSSESGGTHYIVYSYVSQIKVFFHIMKVVITYLWSLISPEFSYCWKQERKTSLCFLSLKA